MSPAAFSWPADPVTSTMHSTVYEFGEFRLDAEKRRLQTVGGETIDVSARVFDTLLCLLQHAGHLVDKRTLMQFVWPDSVVEENNLSQAMTALRRTLGDSPGRHRFVATEPGRGYRFVADVRMRRDDSAASPPPPMPAEASVAVLPFSDLSPDGDQAYFSDGIADELLNRLSKLRGLHVAGRTSSFSFKNKYEDVRGIGEKLNVAHVLEGSVRKAGDRVRIGVQLNKTADGYTLWSDSYDRRLDDIFAIQDEIAIAVADALSITLGVGDIDAARSGTRNFAAYDARLAAQSAFLRQGPENFFEGIELLEKAIAEDPEYADAWSLMSIAYAGEGAMWMPERAAEFLRKSAEAASRAMRIAPEATGSLRAMAFEHGRSWRWATAEQHFNDALESAPTDVITNLIYSQFLIAVGRSSQAVECTRRAVRTDPLALTPAIILGQSLNNIGEIDAAWHELERARGLIGYHELLNGVRAVMAMELGDREAIDKCLSEIEADEDSFIVGRSFTRTMHALIDSPVEALAELRRALDDPATDNPLSRSVIATYASYFGVPELSLEIFLHFAECRAWPMEHVWRPLYKPMRCLPGFKDFVRRAGLVDYWRESGDWGDFCRPLGDDDFECS